MDGPSGQRFRPPMPERRADMEQTRTLRIAKDLLWLVAIAGGTLGVTRFAFGLGASTAMLDALPWGWWKVFNMVAGAALATSAFVVAAMIYILGAQRYRRIARLSVVVGFLGYGSSLAALGFDIGLPHRGWHPVVMWNPHSFLFEVFWCVSLYWSITALELIPLVSERFPFPKFTHLMHEVMLPFVVLGVTLSTMHHSSLGSLFMAAPTRMHPLWHSMWIPPEFMISAMGGGLSVLVLFSLLLTWLYGRPRDMEVLGGLAKWSAILLALYAAIRVVDLSLHHKWSFVFGPDVTWETRLFAVEFALQVAVPVAVLATPWGRRTTRGLVLGCGSAFLGLAMHRMDAGILAFFRTSDAVYVPMASELLISFAVLSAAGLLMLFLVERFHILEEPGQPRGQGRPLAPIWTLAEARALLLPGAARVAKVAVVVVPLTLVVFHGRGASQFRPIAQPVYPSILADDEAREDLRIDADRDGDAVLFPHLLHQQWFQDEDGVPQEETCEECHHLALPGDESTPCRSCHTDMELPQPMFVLARHEERWEDQEDRQQFLAWDLDDPEQNYQACLTCHEEEGEQPMRGLEEYRDKGFSHMAPGFREAMHGNCLTCHREEETPDEEKEAMSLGNCKGCHDWEQTEGALHPEPDASVLWRQGQEMFLGGELAEAEALYREALALDPGCTPADYHLGVLLRVAGRTDEAAEAFGRAAEAGEHEYAVRAREALGRMGACSEGADCAATRLNVVVVP